MKIQQRQYTGVSTLVLLLFAESISLANSVTFWNHYNSWYTRHESTNDSSFTKPARKAQECPAGLETCSYQRATYSAPAPAPGPKLLSPRARAMRTADYCRTCTSRCRKDDLIVRGGHVTLADAAASVVGDSTTEAILTANTPLGLPLHTWKLIFQFFLTLMNVACWLIPLKSKKMSENKVALSLANAFSGGVFLSLAFGHLLPESIHGFEGMNEATPYMLALAGYMLIFFVEKVAFDTDHILHDHSHGEQGNGLKVNPLSNGRGAIILLGALAVHSILEMMALGLADTFGDSALLSLSIALHQPAESIALLVAFIKSGLPERDIIKFLSIFSAMGPIGVLLGIAVNEFAAPIVDASMLAIVAGTFVYVGATEVIPEEFEESENKWKKFFALTSGIISIYVITQYTMTLEGSH